MNNKGSSETTREASVSHFNLQPFYESLTSFNQNLPPSFLEWFIGFTEGDGSFQLAQSPKGRNTSRPVFTINQAEPEILYTIKRSFGFGIVTKVAASKNVNQHYRYRVYKLAHIRQLILLFGDNLQLKKVVLRFLPWVESYNSLCDSNQHQPILGLCKTLSFHLNLNSAWLAGFTDAEGCFYVSLSETKKRTRLRYKFSISQKGEKEVLEWIAGLITKDFSGKHVYIVKNKVDTYRLEFTGKAQLFTLVNYFDNYKLLSRKKRLVYVRWKRVLHRVAPSSKETKAWKRYKRLIASVGKIRLQKKPEEMCFNG